MSIINIINNVRTNNAARQITDTTEAMIRIRRDHPDCTGIVYMGGLRENVSMRREKTMHTICHQGLTIDEAIKEAALRIAKNGSTFSDRIIYMKDTNSMEDITGRVWDKIREMGLNEVIDKINVCREHMAIAGPKSCAILYVNGVKRNETDTLNEEVTHSRVNKGGLIYMAAKVVRRYNYTGKVYILRDGKVEDVTIDVAYAASK